MPRHMGLVFHLKTILVVLLVLRLVEQCVGPEKVYLHFPSSNIFHCFPTVEVRFFVYNEYQSKLVETREFHYRN